MNFWKRPPAPTPQLSDPDEHARAGRPHPRPLPPVHPRCIQNKYTGKPDPEPGSDGYRLQVLEYYVSLLLSKANAEDRPRTAMDRPNDGRKGVENGRL